MVTEIRIYVEGGGQSASAKSEVRRGFGQFLVDLRTLARQKRADWSIIACGSRDDAWRAFSLALTTHPRAFNVLLVDSEEAVREGNAPWRHLQQRDNWTQPSGASDDQCHLMVQAMETWLIPDRESLKRFYGHGFAAGALPGRSDVEAIDRHELLECLNTATRGATKGKYHKIRHGPTLLAQADTRLVRAAAPHCERLFSTLTQALT